MRRLLDAHVAGLATRAAFSMTDVSAIQERGYAIDAAQKERNRRNYENLYKDKEKIEKKWNREPEDWGKYAMRGANGTEREVTVKGATPLTTLASMIGTRPDVIRRMMKTSGLSDVDHGAIPPDVAELIILEFGLKPKIDLEVVDLVLRPPITPNDEKFGPRPPVVTIMGHVDHGKTTLLDYLRKSSVAKGEAGGITQHIGAFSVELKKDKQITFLDTPGHEAFQNMRQRGAQVTDIVVLVVAADDGVMPQTVEAIKHAKNAGAQIIVAINKCDKPHGDLQDLKMQLLNNGVQVEDMGGDCQAVLTSGLTGEGVNELIEAILTQADMMQLRGDPTGPVEGTIVESRVDKHRGKLATMIVQRGTLRPGAVIVAGSTFAKVRQLFDEHLKPLAQVPPSKAVEVIGWKDQPRAGEAVIEAESEELAKTVVEFRERKERLEEDMKARKLVQLRQVSNLEENRKEKQFLLQQKKGMISKSQRFERKDYLTGESDVKRFNTIVKGDVMGSVEAISSALLKLRNEELEVHLVSSGVGSVTESDVELAAAAEALIVAFNLKIPKAVKDLAKRHRVQIMEHRIIYHLLDEVTGLMGKSLPVVEERVVLGEAKVLQVFEISVKGKDVPIGGCKVQKGSILSSSEVVVKRDGKIIFQGPIKQLKVVKETVGKVEEGQECGIMLSNFPGLAKGDLIQAVTSKAATREFVAA